MPQTRIDIQTTLDPHEVYTEEQRAIAALTSITVDADNVFEAADKAAIIFDVLGIKRPRGFGADF